MAALLAVLRGGSQPRPKSKHKSESLPSQQFEKLTFVHNHMAALLRDPEPVEAVKRANYICRGKTEPRAEAVPMFRL